MPFRRHSCKREQELLCPVNIAQQKGYSIRESAAFIAEALGYRGTLVYNTAYPDGDRKKIMSNELFRKIFPDVVFTDHQKAIQKTVEYYLSLL